MSAGRSNHFADTWGEITLGSSKVQVRWLAAWVGVIAWIIATICFTGTQGIIAFSLNVAYLLAVIAACKATRSVPLRRVALCFILGGVMLGVTVLILQPLVSLEVSYPLRAFAMPPLEELLKLIPVFVILYRGRKFTNHTMGASDLLLLGAASGAGFAFVEDAHIHRTTGWQTLSSWLPATDVVNGHIVAGHGIWTAIACATIGLALLVRHNKQIAGIAAVSGLAWVVFDHIVVNYAQLHNDWAVGIFSFLTGNGSISIALFVLVLVGTVLLDLYLNLNTLPKFPEFKLPSVKERSDSLTSVWDFILDRRRLAYAYYRYKNADADHLCQTSSAVAVLAQCLINGHKPKPMAAEKKITELKPPRPSTQMQQPQSLLGALENSTEMTMLVPPSAPYAGSFLPSVSQTSSHGAESSPLNPAIQDIDLPDRYFVISQLSEGGMGVIYRAKHRMTGKQLAIKILHPHVARNTQNLRRFEQEAKAASLLKHPNLVDVLDFGVTSKSVPFLVMDLIEGSNLATDLKEKGPLRLRRFLNIFIQTCDALSHAHKRGVIHRDLKPSNMLLSVRDDGTDFVKIVDFGIAKLVADDGSTTQELTKTGDIIGSPLFMSPEQCMGNSLDNRSDIYSLGCVMYTAMTGSLPFVGTNAVQTIFKQLNEMPVQPKMLRADIPSSVEMVIFKALQKDPASRYQSMEDIQHELIQIRMHFAGEFPDD